MQNKYIVFSRY